MPAFTVTSTAYKEGQAVPREFTCDGANQSPPLAFAGIPPGASHLAVVFDDPDAPRGTWTHWTFWDLPAASNNLPAGVDVGGLGAIEGKTSANSIGYHGPCPPGGTHRYIVHAFATGESLGLPRGASVEVVQATLRKKAVATATLMANYTRA